MPDSPDKDRVRRMLEWLGDDRDRLASNVYGTIPGLQKAVVEKRYEEAMARLIEREERSEDSDDQADS